MELLFPVADSAGDEGEAEHEHAVGEDRADQCGLDDVRQPLVEREERDEELRQVAERGLDHPGSGGARAASELFRGASDDSSELRQSDRSD